MPFFPESISQRHGTAACPALECPAGQASSQVHQVVLPAPRRPVPGAALSTLLTVAVVLGLVPLLMSNDTAPFRVLVPTGLVCGEPLKSSPVLSGVSRLAAVLLTWMQVLSDVCCERFLQPWVASCPLVVAWEEHGFSLVLSGCLNDWYLFFNCLFLVAVGLGCRAQAFSSCSKWRLLFVAMCRLLAAAASLVARGLQGAWAPGSRLHSRGSGFSCSTAQRISLDERWNPRTPCRQAASYPLCHQGGPRLASRVNTRLVQGVRQLCRWLDSRPRPQRGVGRRFRAGGSCGAAALCGRRDGQRVQDKANLLDPCPVPAWGHKGLF